jgi:DNA-binding winged helix-turn-helix (wHTH) protein/tetratricopeptide (TPR) repeat protein
MRPPLTRGSRVIIPSGSQRFPLFGQRPHLPIGLFEADTANRTLTRKGVPVKIQDQPFRALALLLDHAGDVVTREELQQALWPEGIYVNFDGSLNVVLKKLRTALGDDPENPRFIETIPRRGYRWVAPVTIQDPETRPGISDAAPSVAASPVAAEAAHLPPASFRSRPRLGRLLPACVIALVAVILVSEWFLKRSKRFRPARGQDEAASTVHRRKSVAVLGFRNLSRRPDDAWLGAALPEMLRTELAGGETLRLVSGEDIAGLTFASASWPPAGALDQATAARVGTALDADLLVLGCYTTIGNLHRPKLRLDVRLQDARSGEVLAEVAEVSRADDLFQIVSRVGVRLRERLGIPRLDEAGQAGVLATLPLDPEAARFYALGVAKLRQSDARGASDLLEQAAKADPKFSLAHAMLARAWGQLGYEQRRRQEAKKAFDLTSDLPRPQRLLAESDYYASLGNHEKACSVYHALFELFPDSVDYGLQLVGAQLAANRGSEAAKTIAQLRRLPAPASEDPRIDLAEAKVTQSKPDALALIRKAGKKCASQGNELLYAQARHDECMVLAYGQDPGQARPACEDAYRILLAAGNHLGAADCLRLIADGEGTLGHFEAAIATYQRALDILRVLGDHEKTGAVLNNIVFANQGKLDRAEQLYQQAKTHFEQAGDTANEGTTLGNLADILFLRGDLSGAEKLYHRALEIEQRLDPGSPGYTLYRLADLNLMRGRVQQAHRLAQQAVDAFPPQQGSYQYLTEAVIVLGETLEAEGNLAEARQQFEQALAVRQKIKSSSLVAECQVELAGLALEENHPEQAESLLRPAIAEFEQEESDPAASSAYTLLSRALLMEGKLEPSQAAIQRGIQLSHTNSDPALTLSATLQQARLQMARRDANSALPSPLAEQLRSAAATARRLGYYKLECEARLALGELELKTHRSRGRAQLRALASESRSHGLELLARQAEETLGRMQEVVAVNKGAH